MLRRVATIAPMLIASSAAFAHPGDHSQMSLLQVIEHYAEADHLAFLALTIIVGWLAYRHGRRVEAKVQLRTRRPEGDRT